MDIELFKKIRKSIPDGVTYDMSSTNGYTITFGNRDNEEVIFDDANHVIIGISPNYDHYTSNTFPVSVRYIDYADIEQISIRGGQELLEKVLVDNSSLVKDMDKVKQNLYPLLHFSNTSPFIRSCNTMNEEQYKEWLKNKK